MTLLGLGKVDVHVAPRGEVRAYQLVHVEVLEAHQVIPHFLLAVRLVLRAEVAVGDSVLLAAAPDVWVISHDALGHAQIDIQLR